MGVIGKSHGQIGYDAYREFTGGKSLATGQAIPEWEHLPSNIRSAWNIAAAAIVNYVEDKESDLRPAKDSPY